MATENRARTGQTDETDRLISSDKVEGTSVYNRNGDNIGTINHLMIDKISGQVEYAVMSTGGFLGEVHGSGVDLYLDRQGVDTSTPAGKALFQMLGVFAEFERSIIQERIRAGITRARQKGTKSGKPFGRPRISAHKEAKVRALLAAGNGIRKAARLGGVGNETASRIKRELALAG